MVISKINELTLSKKEDVIFTTGVGNHQMMAYQFIHGKYLSEILNDHFFKFAIVGGGISKFVTLSSGLPCIYIPRNSLEKIHLQNIEKFNLGFVLNNEKTLDQGINFIEEHHEEISQKSWLEIDGQGQERLQKAIIEKLD